MYIRRQARNLPNGPVVVRWTTGTPSERKPPIPRNMHDLPRIYGGKRVIKAKVKARVAGFRALERMVNPPPKYTKVASCGGYSFKVRA